jgi:hypothetical protein
MKGKFYIFSIHCTAMQKELVLESMGKTACLPNQNQISELIMHSESNDSQCNMVAMEDKKCCEEVLMEPHL